jgi:hypothetical protein
LDTGPAGLHATCVVLHRCAHVCRINIGSVCCVLSGVLILCNCILQANPLHVRWKQHVQPGHLACSHNVTGRNCKLNAAVPLPLTCACRPCRKNNGNAATAANVGSGSTSSGGNTNTSSGGNAGAGSGGSAGSGTVAGETTEASPSPAPSSDTDASASAQVSQISRVVLVLDAGSWDPSNGAWGQLELRAACLHQQYTPSAGHQSLALLCSHGVQQ